MLVNVAPRASAAIVRAPVCTYRRLCAPFSSPVGRSALPAGARLDEPEGVGGGIQPSTSVYERRPDEEVGVSKVVRVRLRSVGHGKSKHGRIRGRDCQWRLHTWSSIRLLGGELGHGGAAIERRRFQDDGLNGAESIGFGVAITGSTDQIVETIAVTRVELFLYPNTVDTLEQLAPLSQRSSEQPSRGPLRREQSRRRTREQIYPVRRSHDALRTALMPVIR